MATVLDESNREFSAKGSYLYTFASHENERDLCMFELEVLLRHTSEIHSISGAYVRSEINIPPGRSPFIRGKLEVYAEADSIIELLPFASEIKLLPEETFKVFCLKEGDETPDYESARKLERQVGMCIQGKAQMKEPKVTFGLIHAGGKWILGRCTEADRSWQNRRNKPQNYSTGFGVALARSLVNIAIPDIQDHRLLDPCCGMGTVVIEALSMGIEASGNDLNPLAVQGARVNLPAYGYDAACITLGDMNDLQGTYDAAILDMPYNLCSVLPGDEQRAMLTSLRRLTGRAVVVSTEWVENHLLSAGWKVERYCKVSKGTFIRHIWLCT
ncbi:RNA methyltransferase [Paenibacillus sp. MER 99-2]|uniref:TRM11 family SAM-dependent methyltransferase n=1 Tax=Paenibacillus sp. MER 99-2 TaxID=2939572 RepID=UPI00204150A0|nr:RNA methyltransferase [Paenibacillus sp. MER 99-2]MCM3174482.1 RNA methyltransferase [Paenibacillus sp. MER 99-2]